MDINAYPSLYYLISHRYSCRQYSDKAVEEDKILAILDAARLAPSACNRQPWIFIVVNTPELCKAVVDCYQRPWIAPVSTFIVACANHDESWKRADGKDHADIDVAIAVEHICLTATSLGLGTCWVCNFDIPKLRQSLNIPESLEPTVLIPIGYPANGAVASPKIRKTLNEITRWGKF